MPAAGRSPALHQAVRPSQNGALPPARLKRRTKNAKTFHDKCENFNFRASNETAALTAVFLYIKWDHFGYG
ncbi:hypothetical protein E2056_07765 [Escherichia coli]|nr:hypothetical protein [Escherichia coli]